MQLMHEALAVRQGAGGLKPTTSSSHTGPQGQPPASPPPSPPASPSPRASQHAVAEWEAEQLDPLTEQPVAIDYDDAAELDKEWWFELLPTTPCRRRTLRRQCYSSCGVTQSSSRCGSRQWLGPPELPRSTTRRTTRNGCRRVPGRRWTSRYQSCPTRPRAVMTQNSGAEKVSTSRSCTRRRRLLRTRLRTIAWQGYAQKTTLRCSIKPVFSKAAVEAVRLAGLGFVLGR